MNQKNRIQWETIITPKSAVVKQFQAKNNKVFCEVVLPEALPPGTPNIKGWRFCMPAGCIKEEENSIRISFPPSWTTIRFLSPFIKGKQSTILEFPIASALAIMRQSYAI